MPATGLGWALALASGASRERNIVRDLMN
jgi:hypothetical protein